MAGRQDNIIVRYTGTDDGLSALAEKLTAEFNRNATSAVEAAAALKLLGFSASEMQISTGGAVAGAGQLSAALAAQKAQTAETSAVVSALSTSLAGMDRGLTSNIATATGVKVALEALAQAGYQDEAVMEGLSAKLERLAAIEEALQIVTNSTAAAQQHQAEAALALQAAQDKSAVGVLSASIGGMEAALASTQAAIMGTQASLAALAAEGITTGAVVEGLEAKLVNLTATEGLLTTVLTADTTALAANTEATGANLAAHNRLSMSLGGAHAAFTGVSTAALVAAGGLAYASAQALDLDRTMVHLQGNTTLTTEEMGKVKQAVVALAQESGQPFDKLAEGLRTVRDFGFTGSEAMEVLRLSMQNATATGADLVDVATILAVSLKVFGGNARDASGFLDVMFQAARTGHLEMADFAKEMERVFAIGAGFGMTKAGFVDLAAAASALTDKGIEANRAATGLVNILNHIQNPTTEAKDALAALNAQTGNMVTHFSAAGLATVGLKGVLDELEAAYEKTGLTQSLAAKKTDELITGIKGGNMAVILLTTAYGGYTQKIQDYSALIGGQAKLNQEAYNEALEHTSTKFDILMRKIQAFGTEAGNVTIGPLLSELDRLGEGAPEGELPIVKQLRDIIKGIEDLGGASARIDAVRQAFSRGDWGEGLGLLYGATIQVKTGAEVAGQAWLDFTNKLIDADRAMQAPVDALSRIGETAAVTLGGMEQAVADYQAFVESSLPAASQAANRHAADFQNVRNELTAQLNALEVAFRQYSEQALNSYGDAQVAAQIMANKTAEALAIVRGQIAATITAYRMLQMAALDAAGVSYQQAAGAAAVADAQAGASAAIAGNAASTRTAAEATRAHAQANLDAAKATVAHDEQSLAQARAIDVLTGATTKSNLTLAMEAKLRQDNSTVIQRETELIGAQGAATIAANNAAAGKKIDTGADASRQATEALNKQRATDAVRAAQDALNAATEKYRKELEDLDRVMRGLPTLQHVAELDQEAKKIHELTTEYDRLKKSIQDQKDGLEAYKDSAQQSLDLAAQAVKNLQKTLDDFKEHSTDALKGMDRAIEADKDALALWKQMAEGATQPFVDGLKRAQDALKAIEEETRRQDAIFAASAHGLADALDDLQTRENAAAKPYDEQLLADAAAMEALQAEVEAINQKYAVLNDLQRELASLEREDAASQHAKTLHDEQVGIENLTARLATATGAEREQLQAQLAAAQKQQGVDTRKFSLQERIANLEAEKKAEMDAVNLRIHAAELQRAADEKARAAALATYEEQKKNLEEQQRLLDRQRSDYDYEQGKKEQDARDEVGRAQAELDRVQAANEAYVKLAEAKIAGEEAARKVKAEADAVYIEGENKKIEAAQKTYDKVKDQYDAYVKQQDDLIHQSDRRLHEIGGNLDAEKGKVQGLIDKKKEERDKDLDGLGAQLDAWKKRKEALDAAYTAIDKLDTVMDHNVTLTKDQAAALKAARAEVELIVPQLPKLGDAYTAINTTIGTANTTIRNSVRDLWDPTKDDSIPRIVNKGFKAPKMGLDDQIKSALEYEQTEVWEAHIASLPTAIGGALDKAKPTVAGKAGEVGLAIDQAIADSIKDEKNVALITHAIEDAVSKAIADAKIPAVPVASAPPTVPPAGTAPPLPSGPNPGVPVGGTPPGANASLTPPVLRLPILALPAQPSPPAPVVAAAGATAPTGIAAYAPAYAPLRAPQSGGGGHVYVEAHVHVHGAGLPKDQSVWNHVGLEIKRAIGHDDSLKGRVR